MEIKEIKKLTNYKWLNLFAIDFIDASGKPNSWLMASRKNNPLAEKAPRADAVVIVPWHTEERKLVLLHEFRVPINGRQYAFPAGLIDPGETVESTARRELKEETGLDLTEIVMTSPPLNSSAGLTDEAINIVFAHCTGRPRNVSLRAEEAETVLVSQAEALALMRDSANVFDVRAWLVMSGLALHGLWFK